MICAICGKNFKKDDLALIRDAWLIAVGSGILPEQAKVHLDCNKKEQALIKSGKIKLTELFSNSSGLA